MGPRLKNTVLYSEIFLGLNLVSTQSKETTTSLSDASKSSAIVNKENLCGSLADAEVDAETSSKDLTSQAESAPIPDLDVSTTKTSYAGVTSKGTRKTRSAANNCIDQKLSPGDL